MARPIVVRLVAFALVLFAGLVAVPRASAQLVTLADLALRVSALEAQVTTLKNDVAALNVRATSLQTQLNTLSTQLAATKTQLNVAVANIEVLQAKVAILEAAFANLSLTDLADSACTTPTGQAGTLRISQYRSGVVMMRCQKGNGRYIDNGDGTLTDTQTGLMWELKVDGANCLRCVADTYALNKAGEWVDRMNGRYVDNWDGAGFAGYTDWRLPTLAELKSIMLPYGQPPIDPAFGLTENYYWTASRLFPYPDAWYQVGFISHGILYGLGNFHVRAVRKAW